MAYPWRHDQEMQWLQRVVGESSLGKVVRIHAHSIVAGAGPADDSWFVDRALSGGGALLDVGCHTLNSISLLFGDTPRCLRLFATRGTQFRKISVEDTATLLLELSNGVTVVLDAGWHHAVAQNPHGALEIFGSAGYARVFPARMVCSNAGAQGEFSPFGFARASHIGPEMYQAQVEAFLDTVLEGREPICDGRQGLRDLQVIDAAYKSAMTGKAISFEEQE
jgi:predicted dehydrogenase